MRGFAVIGERDAAVGAFRDEAAFRAEHVGGVAAAIEEEDDLFFFLEAGVDCVAEFAREDEKTFLADDFLAHVDDAHDGHFLVVNADGERRERVAAALGVVKGFERGGGGAEDDGGAFDFAAHDGDVAGVVTRGFFLFVAGLVFLVDDDETEGLHGREDRRARANHDVRLAVADFVPLIVAFTSRKVAVEDGDFLFLEAGAEAFDGLRGQRDFGNEDDGVLALMQGVLDGLEIDFGFAAAGDAVDEDGSRNSAG